MGEDHYKATKEQKITEFFKRQKILINNSRTVFFLFSPVWLLGLETERQTNISEDILDNSDNYRIKHKLKNMENTKSQINTQRETSDLLTNILNSQTGQTATKSFKCLSQDSIGSIII